MEDKRQIEIHKEVSVKLSEYIDWVWENYDDYESFIARVDFGIKILATAFCELEDEGKLGLMNQVKSTIFNMCHEAEEFAKKQTGGAGE